MWTRSVFFFFLCGFSLSEVVVYHGECLQLILFHTDSVDVWI